MRPSSALLALAGLALAACDAAIEMTPEPTSDQDIGSTVLDPRLPTDRPADERPRCLTVEPPILHFGAAAVGSEHTLGVVVSACDGAEVAIEAKLEAPGEAIALLPVSGGVVSLRFTPDAPIFEDQGPGILGSLTLTDTLSGAARTIDVLGAALTPQAPIVRGRLAEGKAVLTGDLMHLVGSGTVSGSAPVTAWSWQASGPGPVQFVPHAEVADPAVVIDQPGAYTFTLTVTNAHGLTSVGPSFTVEVLPLEDLRVELTWTSPGGADLDLHFAHPFAGAHGAGDPWFAEPWDCFWYNPSPDWGSLDPEAWDDPVLVTDDPANPGLETLSLPIAEEGSLYAVGVHYWQPSDAPAQPAYATIRVFAERALVLEVAEVELFPGDLWEVGQVDNLGEVIRFQEDGQPQMRQAYPVPVLKGQ